MLKKLIMVVVASTALAVPGIAPAAHGFTFNSRGECESFLAQFRNNARKAAKATAGKNSGEFNREFPNVVCQRNDNGTFTTVVQP